jgi:hypothetical protein
MKKVIRLTESELIKLVKRVILEQELDEDSLVVSPYELTASGGYIVIKDTKNKKNYKYELKVKKGFWIGVDVDDFPGGNTIKASGLGMSKTINIDKNIVKNILSKKLGQSEIEFNIDDHQIKFVKV